MNSSLEEKPFGHKEGVPEYGLVVGGSRGMLKMEKVIVESFDPCNKD